MDETERAELIAALHQSVAFGEAMPELNERLLDALSPGASRPTPMRSSTCERGSGAGRSR
jgi:hypothetical protein